MVASYLRAAVATTTGIDTASTTVGVVAVAVGLSRAL